MEVWEAASVQLCGAQERVDSEPDAYTLLYSSACPGGSYKALAGNAACSPCPARSHAPDPAAPVCPCLSGFYRASSDPPEAPCTGESPTFHRGGNRTGVGLEEGDLRATRGAGCI